MRPTAELFRVRRESGPGQSEVKSVELFFDLVFVFAITQLSHLLISHLSLVGALQTGLLLLAVWWVWIYTSWVTNWLDPDSLPVRLLLFVLMLAGPVLSASIPGAFEMRALPFALAYVFMQIGRSVFMLWAVKAHSEPNFRNFQRITLWLVVSGVFWIAGAFLEPSDRLIVWAVAMLIEFISPSVGFWVPGLGRSSTEDWDVSGDHMAERCGLFVIIALGESLLVTGATWAELEWSALTIAAFVVGVVGTIAMWWIYFHIGAERARKIIVRSDDPGRWARLAYTYIHMPLIAGIIVGAVGDEIILKHPAGHTDLASAAILLGGPALFLLGNLFFKWATAGWPPFSHLMGLAVLAALSPLTIVLPPLAIGAAATLAMVFVAAWEARSLAAARGGTGPRAKVLERAG
jgi:low temperature requirement protein LtrA